MNDAPGTVDAHAATFSTPDHSTTPPLTGLAAVDRVVAREPEIAALPVTERAAAHEDLHRELEAILTRDPGHPSGLTGS